MDSLPEIRRPHIDDLLEAMTFSTESINDYISAIGSHISHLSTGLDSIQQYLSKFSSSSLQLEDLQDSLYLLLAGRQRRHHKFDKTYSDIFRWGCGYDLDSLCCNKK